MTTDVQTTPAERVYAILSEEHEGSRQVWAEGVNREPYDGSEMTVRERDLRDWGLVYGLAFGMLASEEPDADREQIRDRALDAARAAYRRWAGAIAPRPSVSPHVDAALLGFEDAEQSLGELLYIHKQDGLRPLIQSMQALRDVLGVPAREAAMAA
jgi:hypothetical protein